MAPSHAHGSFFLSFTFHAPQTPPPLLKLGSLFLNPSIQSNHWLLSGNTVKKSPLHLPGIGFFVGAGTGELPKAPLLPGDIWPSFPHRVPGIEIQTLSQLVK